MHACTIQSLWSWLFSWIHWCLQKFHNLRLFSIKIISVFEMLEGEKQHLCKGLCHKHHHHALQMICINCHHPPSWCQHAGDQCCWCYDEETCLTCCISESYRRLASRDIMSKCTDRTTTETQHQEIRQWLSWIFTLDYELPQSLTELANILFVSRLSQSSLIKNSF